MLKSASGKVRRCAQCSYQSEWTFQLHRHARRLHNNKDLRHIESCHGSTLRYEHCKQKRRYECDKCKLVACSALSLVGHAGCRSSKPGVAVAPSSGGKDDRTVAEKIASYILYNSKYKFNLKRNMLLHAGDVEGVEWHECRYCAYRTQNKSGLRSHQFLRHGAKVRGGARPQCQQCSYRAKDGFGLRTHMLKHARDDEVDWFACDRCPFRTKYERSLTQHASRHEAAGKKGGSETFKCANDGCSYRTEMRSRLKRHRAVHHQQT